MKQPRKVRLIVLDEKTMCLPNGGHALGSLACSCESGKGAAPNAYSTSIRPRRSTEKYSTSPSLTVSHFEAQRVRVDRQETVEWFHESTVPCLICLDIVMCTLPDIISNHILELDMITNSNFEGFLDPSLLDKLQSAFPIDHKYNISEGFN